MEGLNDNTNITMANSLWDSISGGILSCRMVNIMTEYHKIETLFERDEKTFVVKPDQLKSSVLATISSWDVTEKIDGTNIRVMLDENGEVTFGGRTDNAQLQTDLLQKLYKMFPADKLKEVFWLEGKPTNAILYGEGYGAGIQKGGVYRPDKSFILFDVLVANQWWLDWDNVKDVAAKLNLDVVPYLGRMTLDQIIELVKSPFQSKIGTAVSEGIVARPIEPLFDKRGKRIIIKLKTKDFAAGKR